MVGAENTDKALLFQYFVDIGGIFVPIAFLNFAISLLGLKRDPLRLGVVSWFVGIIISVFSFSPLFKLGVKPQFGFNFWIYPGPYYLIFPIAFTAFIAYSCFLLIRAFRRTEDAVLKQQIKYVFGAQILGFSGGATNFLPQLFNVYPVGNYLVALYVVFISYAIFKHHLFNIKVIATEMFTAILLFLLFLNIFSANSVPQYAFNIGIFMTAGVLGWLLIRSVLFEVSSREKIAKLAKQLQSVNDKLQQVDKVKTEFISIASHQLRTPLTIIKGYTSMALEGSFGRYTKQQHDVMDKLFQSANRLINLVEDLLNISRLEQGRIEYEYKVIDPVALVRGVVEELEPKAKKKGLRLIFVKPKHSVPHIRADEQKMRQVYINVIDNAVKYTEKGSVTVSLHRDEDKVRFESVDTGIGITKDDLSTLFHKFVRGSHVTQMYTEGVGLGLYFARKVAENHGGKIWAESSGKDQGSKFIVELPMAS